MTPPDRRPDVVAMQAEIDARRKAGRERFEAILCGSVQAPRLNFTGEPLSTLQALIADSPVSPIVVSFHTSGYFQLMRLIASGAPRCAAIVNASIVKQMDGVTDEALRRVDFHTALTPSLLRSFRAGQRPLFIMADVFLPYGSNAPLPFRGRALRYTISWAELALRYGTPVALCLLKDGETRADVHIEILPDGFATPYHLAFDMFRRFERCLGDDDDLWENHPAMARFGRPLPASSGGVNTRLISEVGRLSLCDTGLAASVRGWLEENRPC